MKNKYILIKLLGVASLIAVVILYFIVYFVPSVKTISHKKLQLKDLNLKIKDFVKTETKFAFSNDEERRLFRNTEHDLMEKIPVIRSKEDFIRLITRVSNYIRQLAEKDGVMNLVISSESSEMKLNAGTLSSDSQSFQELLAFSTSRLARMQHNDFSPGMKQGAPKPRSGLFALQENIECHTVTLSFSGPMRSSMNFINHIPWGPFYLTQDKMVVAEGPGFPYCIVFLKIYYVSLKPTTPAGSPQ